MENPKRILLVAEGKKHPSVQAIKALRDFIELDGEINLSQISTPEHFPEDLNQFDVLILYFHLDTISTQSLVEFEEFVLQGGGVLALHSATASFLSRPKYLEIIGGRFVEHDVISEFVVKPVTENPIFSSVKAFSIKDELYIHQILADINVHFTANLEGEDVPVVWTRRFGRGNVFYASPGHRTETLSDPMYQDLILKGLKWLCKQ